QPLSERDREIASIVGPELRARGLLRSSLWGRFEVRRSLPALGFRPQARRSKLLAGSSLQSGCDDIHEPLTDSRIEGIIDLADTG
ncbi:hypothetical protein Q0O91_13805, partial [Staphylococcus aureus]|nr:hypothetical protein [Staphylococcus aureus]